MICRTEPTTVRLVLRDSVGHTYREFKTFVIASKPPVVQLKLETKRYHRGQTMPLKATASQSNADPNRATGRQPAIALKWDAGAAITQGSLSFRSRRSGHIQADRNCGDIAHNIGTQEVQVEVLP